MEGAGRGVEGAGRGVDGAGRGVESGGRGVERAGRGFGGARRVVEGFVLYDADCGLCRWTVAWLLRWDRRRALAPVEIQGLFGQRLLEPVPAEERLESWHLVTADGCVHSAGAAFAPVARLLPGGGLLAPLAAATPALSERVYRWVARNRSWLGRMLPARAKAASDRLIAARAVSPEALPAKTRRC